MMDQERLQEIADEIKQEAKVGLESKLKERDEDRYYYGFVDGVEWALDEVLSR